MNRVEDQLWDFTQTLEMWKATDFNIKQKRKIEFCEDIAGFANAQGGVIILGITDKIPRKKIGLKKLKKK